MVWFNWKILELIKLSSNQRQQLQRRKKHAANWTEYLCFFYANRSHSFVYLIDVYVLAHVSVLLCFRFKSLAKCEKMPEFFQQSCNAKRPKMKKNNNADMENHCGASFFVCWPRYIDEFLHSCSSSLAHIRVPYSKQSENWATSALIKYTVAAASATGVERSTLESAS